MGEWHEVKTILYSNHPCHSCQHGWGSLSQKEVNGKLYEKIDDCHEDCEELKLYNKVNDDDRSPLIQQFNDPINRQTIQGGVNIL